ncbi:MAG: AAA family ATPase [Crocinitomicaceae bacterium]
MKHINNINISNFKSIRQASIEDCNVINVFIGKPNAGKSNLLEALGLRIMFQQDDNMDSLQMLANLVRFQRVDQLFYQGAVAEQQNGTIVIDGQDLTFQRVSGGIRFETSFREFVRVQEFNQTGTKLLSSLEQGFTTVFLSNFSLRRYIFKSGSQLDNMGSHHEYHLKAPFGENLGYVAYHNSYLLNYIQNEIKRANRKFVLDNLYQIKIQLERFDGLIFEHGFEMLADTVQRVIFHQAAILSNKESVLLFEEPEAHCFEPYIQEFTNAVKYDKNKNQFFIVTHSDFIIQEFLRDDDSKAKTNIYLVNNVQGETQVKLMKRENNEDVYELGMNAFFNFDQLWENN